MIEVLFKYQNSRFAQNRITIVSPEALTTFQALREFSYVYL